MGKSTEVDGDNNPTSSESDPAKLLEAALLQMDGIIAEAGGPVGAPTGSTGRAARARALELAQQLGSSLQHAVPPPPRPDFTTASAILRWLQQNNNMPALLRTHRPNEGQRTGFVGLRCCNLDGLANANDRSLACAGDPKRGGNIKEIELFERTLFGRSPKTNERTLS
ncbi:unnamed protein product [Plutella xylostella]|uniref:(diamondback moth) hypothetical protein n=1 Tax=Plutella xylostella TaxID=51655 RepID=A0A8S4D8G2_PLUXY|nr:unnamed protein product [Plutella xylostella]